MNGKYFVSSHINLLRMFKNQFEMMLTLTDIARERPGSAHRCCNCRSDPNPDVYMGRGRARNLELAHQMRLGW